MDLDDALSVLGLTRGTSWAEIRVAYRARIRAVHPDLAAAGGPAGRSDDDAVRLNAAFAVLEPVYRRGLPPPSAADDGLVLFAPADEVFVRLADAIDDIGSVTYADPESGYIQALVADGAGQLVVTLTARGETTDACFILEPTDVRPVPAIDQVVRRIAAYLRTGEPPSPLGGVVSHPFGEC